MTHLPNINSSILKSLRAREPELVITETVIYASLSVAALFGNSLVLWIVYKNRVLRTIPNYFVISLAFTDICMALLGTPWSIVVLATGGWPSSFTGCQVQGFLVIWFAIASLQNLMIMAFNRYCRIVNQSLYRRIFTRKRTKLLIFLAYVVAAIAPLPYIIGGEIYVFQPGKFFCYQKSVIDYTMPLMLIFIGVPTVIVVICYLKVFFALRKHQTNLHKPQSKRGSNFQRITVEEIRITKTLFATVVGYLLCWMPVLLIEIIDLGIGQGSLPRQVYMIFTMCGLSSSAINPIIYGVMNKTFRREYKKAFICRVAFRESNTVHSLQSNSQAPPVTLTIQHLQ